MGQAASAVAGQPDSTARRGPVRRAFCNRFPHHDHPHAAGAGPQDRGRPDGQAVGRCGDAAALIADPARTRGHRTNQNDGTRSTDSVALGVTVACRDSRTVLTRPTACAGGSWAFDDLARIFARLDAVTAQLGGFVIWLGTSRVAFSGAAAMAVTPTAAALSGAVASSVGHKAGARPAI